MPFVWKDYDINNRLVYDDWLRINEPGELVDKLYSKSFGKMLRQTIIDYDKKLPSPQDYRDMFEQKLLAAIK